MWAHQMSYLNYALHGRLSQQPLNAGHTDVETFGQPTGGSPLLIPRDKAAYVRLAQPITGGKSVGVRRADVAAI